MNTKHSKHCLEKYLWKYELHGLSQVIIGKTLRSRIIWISIIFTCTFIALCTTYEVVTEYIDLKTTTLITFKRAKRLKMPTIVVCPKNPDAVDIERLSGEIKSKLPFITPNDTKALISFAIAGSGLANMERLVYSWTSLQGQRYHAMLQKWKGPRSYIEFYNDIFFKYGYKCKDLFYSCYIGYDRFDCCEKFTPQYVMLRGKCYRMEQHYQEAPDIHGRIALLIRQLPSPFVEENGRQPQAVVFVSDNYTDISTFPRYYINLNEAIFVHFSARLLRMSPFESECSMLEEDKGRATCYVKKYHEYRVLGPLNCSLFYLNHRVEGYQTCEPLDIVYNYNVVVNGAIGFIGERCLPHCNRWYYEFGIYRSEINERFKPKNETVFRFESGFTNLEYEVYEQIRTTTLPGFVSQIGGQSGLFLGFSVMTLVQFSLSMFRFGKHGILSFKNK
ncbi:unnamed protein product [Bursaphelenchus okinawaensis]|uniref:Uncharacterized protein n=1 Tax=Bursaphelenchus okinawaensis TaxID=465554 RepID=A0A811LLG8_9BILA|nr:unnamed protein product [Bursaphelenchus okinawaensis]CAG9124028.1 unnamed protein product [Bursaphelenchus okinawaensis]